MVTLLLVAAMLTLGLAPEVITKEHGGTIRAVAWIALLIIFAISLWGVDGKRSTRE